ncbi:tyrosine-type recombinase/integrase [Streptomyces europaeiscabiei]|uniref:tyrosine-type recombinase/integrase n=1 Tax=Streptomyces europaeiscabiei TaxID=146819 RepID=UPI0029A9FFBF|nr:tyrosine-type recombinase/integrase [Streptomyces europaeiscabiei]MDX2758184.1 tyrosine-type recombinase/integrase [Streptomyces europaeiscabiei]
MHTELLGHLGDRLPGLRHDPYRPLAELRVVDALPGSHDPQLSLRSRSPRYEGRFTQEAGYEGCHPHQFRHTATDDMLSAGMSGEDVMTIQGWKDPTMLRRYAADMAVSRAVKAARKMGDRY